MLAADLLAALPPDAGAVCVRDGARTLIAAAPEETMAGRGPDALAALGALAGGWWAGFLSYDLGRAIERVVPHARDDLEIPDLVLGRFDARIALERGRSVVEGEGPSRPLLERAMRDVTAGRAAWAGPALSGWTSSLDRGAHRRATEAALERIRNGDCYQVNLTRRLLCDREADPVALFAALDRHNPAPHAAFVRLGGIAVASASPERFLRLERATVETRPIKGTGTDPRALAASAKDRAENVMIVDLARNDLGRVCEPGTVRVPELCAVEQHPGLYHLVSTVVGRLRPEMTIEELVRAAHPPASITGAPKPRVMQIIEDLEPVRRGVYCGAIGWIDIGARSLDLNVAIRTFVVARGTTSLGVGGGIVADSDPEGEWRETGLKAARLLEAAGMRPAMVSA